MSETGRTRLVWSLGGAACACLLGAMGLTAWWGDSIGQIVMTTGMPALAFSAMGVLLCLRAPRNPISWLFLGVGAGYGVGTLFDVYSSRPTALGSSAGAAANFLEAPFVIAGLVGVLLLFPDGRLASRRSRALAALAAVALLLFALTWTLEPGQLSLTVNQHAPRNPLAVGAASGPARVLQAVGVGALFVTFAVALTAAGRLVVRGRRAAGLLRQQLKWFGAAAALMALILMSGPAALWNVSWGGAVFVALVAIGEIAMVLATGVAILRYRLYEIDVIVRKTLIYTTLVASLALVYLGGVSLIDRVLQTVTGQSSALAVTLSTLAVAAAFQPLRRRIQRGVDRRFYRGSYDAARTLDAFASRLRDQIDLTALQAEMLGVTGAALQPSHASLWLRPSESRATDSPTGTAAVSAFPHARRPIPQADE